MPNDFLTLIEVSCYDKRFKIKGNYIVTDDNYVTITYVSKVPVENLPTYICEAIAHYLLTKTIKALTENATDRTMYEKLADITFTRAVDIDSRYEVNDVEWRSELDYLY